jgi:hypothetical protein
MEDKMKIKSIEVIFTWEDGKTDDVSSYLPDGTNRDLEDFADYWEAEHGKNEEIDHEEECGK